MEYFHCASTSSTSENIVKARQGVSRTLQELIVYQKSGSTMFFSPKDTWGDIAMAYARLAFFDEKEGKQSDFEKHKTLALNAAEQSGDKRKADWKLLRAFVEKVDANFRAKVESGKIAAPPGCDPAL